MTSDRLLVDHAALDRVATDLELAVRAIEERLQRLEGELAPLRHDWSGQAQQAYAEAKARWDRTVADLRALLAEMHVAVRQSNLDYRATDARGAALFGG